MERGAAAIGNATPQRLDALTGVRGVAAWLVVLYHVRGALPVATPPWVMSTLDHGYLAVDLFFVLSGFVLWLTWQRRFGEQGWLVSRAFIAKRVARVWPLHVVALGVTVAFALAIEATGRPLPAHYRWDELPLHLFLLQNWGFTPRLAWNDPSWSSSTELAAYLLFPALAWGLHRVSKTWALLAALAVLIAGLDLVYAGHGGNLGAAIAELGLWRCLIQFACGMIACALWQRHQALTVAVASAVVAAAVVLALADSRQSIVAPLGFAALVPLLAATTAARGNLLASRPLVWLGDLSYSTYLSHLLLWVLFKLALSRSTDLALPVVGAYLAIVLIASIVLRSTVERPGERLVLRLLDRRSRTHRAPA